MCKFGFGIRSPTLASLATKVIESAYELSKPINLEVFSCVQAGLFLNMVKDPLRQDPEGLAQEVMVEPASPKLKRFSQQIQERSDI